MDVTEALAKLDGALPENPGHDRGSVSVPTDAIRAVVAAFTGEHEGPCLNYPGQDPGGYSEYDACCFHRHRQQELQRLLDVGRVEPGAG